MSEPKSTAEVLYPESRLVEQTLEVPLQENIPKLADAFGYSRETRESLKRTHAEMLGASVLARDAREIHGLITKHLIDPVAEEQHASSAAESRKWLREEFAGTRHNPDQILREVRVAIASNPALRKALEDSGLGNDRRVLRAIVRRVLVNKGEQI